MNKGGENPQLEKKLIFAKVTNWIGSNIYFTICLVI